MKRLLLIALLFAGIARAQDDWANRPQDLALLVPADTLFLVQVNDLGGWKQFIEGTALGRIWAEPEMQQFITGMREAYAKGIKNAQGGFDPFAMVGLQQSDLEGIEVREMGFAVIEANLRNGQPYLDAVFTLRFRAGQENASRIHDALRGALQTYAGVPFEEIELQGRKVYKTQADALPILMTMYADRFILTTSDDRMDLVMTAINKGQPKPLATAPRFSRGVERLGAQRHAVLAYANVPAIADRIAEGMRQTGRGEEVDSGLQMWRALGLDSLDALFYADVPSGTGYRTEFACTINGRRGVFSLLPMGKVNHRFAGQVPAGSLAYGASSFDLGAWFDSLITFGNTIHPGAVDHAMAGLSQANQFLGVDLRKDLLGSLGKDWAWYLGAPPQGGALPDMVGFASLRDGDRFEGAMLKIIDKAREMAAKGRMRLEVGETNFRGTRIRFVELADRHGDPIPVTPSWALGDDFVVFGLWPQSVKHALMEKKSIQANGDFLALRRRLPEGTMDCAYIDTRTLVGWAYNSLVPVAQGMQGAINKVLVPFMVQVNFQDLPPAEVITRHLEPMICYTAVEEDCIRSGFISSFGTAGAVVPLGFLAGLSVALIGRGEVVAHEIVREHESASRGRAKRAERRKAEKEARAAMEDANQALRRELEAARRNEAELEGRLRAIEEQMAELRRLVEEAARR